MSTSIRYLVGNWVAACAVAWLSGGITACGATVEQYGGTKPTVWPTTTWTPLSGLNDPDDNYTETLDFVGNETNLGAYWAMDSNYVYFRMRMDVGSVSPTTYTDASGTGSVWIFIDNTTPETLPTPDYAFVWDSKSAVTTHGLEMQVFGTGSGTWTTTDMNDIDGAPQDKLARDINGLSGVNTYRTGDGYVRSVDSQSTTAFGTTSFLDFAVSWDYLTSTDKGKTTLNKGQDWNVAFGSLANATDHNKISGDVAGYIGPSSSINLGWSGTFNTQEVPEPSSLVVLGVVAFSSYVGFRLRRGTNVVVEKAAI